MKLCKSCSCENNDTCRFCKQCGAAFDEAALSPENTLTLEGYSFRPVPDEEIRALVNKKTPLWERLLAFVTVIALLLGITFMTASVRSESLSTKEFEMLGNGNEDEYIFLCDGKKVKGSLKGQLAYFSGAGDVRYAITADYDIYLITEESVEKIGEEAQYSIVSPNGRYIFYTDIYGVGTVYDTAKKEAQELPEKADIASAVFSPDGETLIFNKIGTSEAFLFDGKECNKIGDDIMCLAVANNAKRLYAVTHLAQPQAPVKPEPDDFEEYEVYKEAYDAYKVLYDKYEQELENYEKYSNGEVSDTLWYYPEADEDKRVKLCDDVYGLCSFNKNVSEIVYYDSSLNTYYCKKGGKPEVIAEEFIVPVDQGYVSKSIYDCDSLLSMNYSSADALYYVNSLGKKEKIISGEEFIYTNPQYSSTGRSFSYVDSEDKLFVAKTKSGKKERIAKDVFSYVAASDRLKAFYVLSNEGELSYVKDSGKSDFISSDVTRIVEAISGGIYYISEDKLYFANKGDTEKVELGDYDIIALESGEDYVLCVAYDKKEDKYITYVSTDDDKGFTDSFEGYTTTFFD